MITDSRRYARIAAARRAKELQRLTVKDSVAIGEALLTSELMDIARFVPRGRPKSLALALGIICPASKTPRRKGPRGAQTRV